MKVDSFLPQQYQQHNLANNQNKTYNTKEAFDDKEEIVIEISRDEMKTYYDEPNKEGSQL